VVDGDVLLTDERGLPLGYTIVAANEKEYEPLADLLTGTPAEVVIGDKGFWGRDYAAQLAAPGTTLLTPNKTRTAANLGPERALASTRLVIESVFANLKGQMRLELHLARTPAGLAVRIAQRILALSLGILLNTLSGRPPRALAAYDGRRITSSLWSSPAPFGWCRSSLAMLSRISIFGPG
jgi:hypothetical protein